MTGSGDLAIISFQALTAGTSLITFANVIWMDSSLGDIVLARLTGGTGPSAVRRSRNPAPGSSSPPAARRYWAIAGGAAAARKSALPVGVSSRHPDNTDRRIGRRGRPVYSLLGSPRSFGLSPRVIRRPPARGERSGLTAPPAGSARSCQRAVWVEVPATTRRRVRVRSPCRPGAHASY